MKAIYCDTREKPEAIGGILRQMSDAGYTVIRHGLYAGDWQLVDNPHLVVDRKWSMNELSINLGSGAARLIREIDRGAEIGIKIIFLCAIAPEYQSIEDFAKWVNPREGQPRAIKGSTLAKTAHSLEVRHGCEFRFCTKHDCGKEILRILEGGANG